MAEEDALPAPVRRRHTKGIIIGLILGIIGTALLIYIILALIFQPKAPEFTIESVSVSKLALMVGNQAPILDSKLTLTISMRNPNHRIGFYYDQITVYLYYHDFLVAASSVLPMYQGYHGIDRVSTNLVAQKLQVATDLAFELGADINNRAVPLSAELSIKARARIGSLTSSRLKIERSCHITVPSAGQVLLGTICS